MTKHFKVEILKEKMKLQTTVKWRQLIQVFTFENREKETKKSK